MPLELVTIPCLSDNYAFLLHEAETGETAVIDVPEAGPILAALKKRGWHLTEIWITHHHSDHIDGVAELRDETGAKVVGASADSHRLPPLNLALTENKTFMFAGHLVQSFDVSGHTVGHIAFYVSDASAVFTADSLMALGCGRLFEGTAEQMLGSMNKIAALPPETIVCSGHEYTKSNAKFALTIELGNNDLKSRTDDINKARDANLPTVPSTLALELATNPFLRSHLPQVKAAVGMDDASDAAVFAEIRSRKDAF